MGVTGGTPVGFDVGAPSDYATLPGLDLGVRGMRVGGQRKLLVPPNLVRDERETRMGCLSDHRCSHELRRAGMNGGMVLVVCLYLIREF